MSEACCTSARNRRSLWRSDPSTSSFSRWLYARIQITAHVPATSSTREAVTLGLGDHRLHPTQRDRELADRDGERGARHRPRSRTASRRSGSRSRPRTRNRPRAARPTRSTYTQSPMSTICAVSSRRGLAFGVPGGNATAIAVVHDLGEHHRAEQQPQRVVGDEVVVAREGEHREHRERNEVRPGSAAPCGPRRAVTSPADELPSAPRCPPRALDPSLTQDSQRFDPNPARLECGTAVRRSGDAGGGLRPELAARSSVTVACATRLVDPEPGAGVERGR